MNPQLYALAKSSPAIFHDIASGDNIVTVACGRRSPNCGKHRGRASARAPDTIRSQASDRWMRTC